MRAIQQLSAHRFPGQPEPGRNLTLLAEAVSGMVERAVGSFSVCPLAAKEDGQEGTVLAVRGELDLVTAPILLEAVLSVLEHRTGPLVMDLSDVSFMDSAGVHVLVDTLGRLEAQNRRLVITYREHEQVHRLLSLVGLLDAVHRAPPRHSAGGGTPRPYAETDLADPTIALAMARSREPARPAVLSPVQRPVNHPRVLSGRR